MSTLTEAASSRCPDCWRVVWNGGHAVSDRECQERGSFVCRLVTEATRLRADFARDQAELASMRITVAEAKADLEQAAKVTEELVGGLSEETRKRQVAEVELERLKRALRRVGARLLEPNGAIVDTIWLDGNPRSPGPTLVEFICARLGLDDLEALKEPSDG